MVTRLTAIAQLVALTAAMLSIPSSAAPTLMHAPIKIASDTDFLNPANGVTGGTGTPSDPYVISGWTITTQLGLPSTTVGIDIHSTTAAFIVRDVAIEVGFQDGIALTSIKNGMISDVVTAGSWHALLVKDSDTVEISSVQASFQQSASHADAALVRIQASGHVTAHDVALNVPEIRGLVIEGGSNFAGRHLSVTGLCMTLAGTQGVTLLGIDASCLSFSGVSGITASWMNATAGALASISLADTSGTFTNTTVALGWDLAGSDARIVDSSSKQGEYGVHAVESSVTLLRADLAGAQEAVHQVAGSLMARESTLNGGSAALSADQAVIDLRAVTASGNGAAASIRAVPAGSLARIQESWFADSATGLSLDGAPNAEISNNTFRGIASQAVSVQHSSGARISDNRLVGPIGIYGISVGESAACQVHRNTVTDATRGIEVAGAACLVEGNVVRGGESSVFVAAPAVVIQGNDLHEPSYQGITTGVGAPGLVIRHNRIWGNATTGIGMYGANGTAESNVVMGNFSNGISGGPVLAGWRITNNTVSGAYFAGISLQGENVAAVADNLVQGNHITNSRWGVSLHASHNTIQENVGSTRDEFVHEFSGNGPNVILDNDVQKNTNRTAPGLALTATALVMAFALSRRTRHLPDEHAWEA